MRDEWRRSIRTAIQVVIALAASAPVLVPALGISTATSLGAGMIAIAAAVSRLSAIPSVAELLNKYFKVPLP